MASYDQVVSLGGWCIVTEHMRRLEVVGPSGPFDFVGFEFDTLADVFANDADGLAKDVVPGGYHGGVICKRYGCVLTHEFRRDDRYVPVVDDRGIDLCRRRLQRRWTSLKQACGAGRRTLFVRASTFGSARAGSVYEPVSRPMTTADVDRLRAAIGARFPRLSFDIALVYHQELHAIGDLVGAENFILYRMPMPDFDRIPYEQQWLGDCSEWDRFADVLDLPRRPGASPASNDDLPEMALELE